MAAGNDAGEKGAKAKDAQKQKGALVKKIKKNVTDVRLELKRVTWPTWRELLNYTTTVLFVCAVMGIIIYVLDFALSRVLFMTLDIGT
ncbi:MAG: preprotein translocase subunit SecE [Clostridiales bacterium]|jgi:preprotein translocase subunit SecE|nr:preprotein translocase subunit SecE [Clostridiales bacterium]